MKNPLICDGFKNAFKKNSSTKNTSRKNTFKPTIKLCLIVILANTFTLKSVFEKNNNAMFGNYEQFYVLQNKS